MQLFYLFNGWAGRSAFIDAAMRFFYVGAVPLLATVLAAALLFRPAARDSIATGAKAPSGMSTAWRIAISTVLSALLCGLSMAAINAFARHYLHSDILSPRPFVTHWVNALVVEPNDNSFPSPELMLAGVFATALWALETRLGAWAWSAVALLGFARLFCGTNYPVDVVAGALVGWAWTALVLALIRVPLPLPSRQYKLVFWRARRQALGSAAVLGMMLLGTGFELARTPRYALAMRTLWNAPWKLSPVVAQPVSSTAPSENLGKATPNPAHEGEGVATLPENEIEAPAPGFASHYGRQPQAEANLASLLNALHLPHEIVDIEVAQVRAGNTPYRAAMVRFAIAQPGDTYERKRATVTASRLVQGAFAADTSIQNVDVTGVIKRAAPVPTPSPLLAASVNAAATARNWVWTPAFTVSVQRRNLRIINGPQWANAHGVDPGLWLRARSRLFIDSQVLPPSPRAVPVPIATPKSIATPKPIITPRPTGTPESLAAPKPTATPEPTATPRPMETPQPKPAQSTLARTKPATPAKKLQQRVPVRTVQRSSRTVTRKRTVRRSARRRYRTRSYRSRRYRVRRYRRRY